MTTLDTWHITPSPLDSHRFGIPVARTTLSHHDHVVASRAYCHANGITLLIVRCAVADIRIAQQLETNGARLMDTLLYLRHPLQHIAANPPLPMTHINVATPDDAHAVGTIARAAFRGYLNHYSADARLDAAASDEVYVSWAQQACHEPQVAEVVLLATYENIPAGFGVIQRTAPTVGDGRLYAVLPQMHGRGIYRQLLLHSLQWCHARGCDSMLYSTQLTNTAAQRGCIQLGFLPDQAYYTFHWWFDVHTL